MQGKFKTLVRRLSKTNSDDILPRVEFEDIISGYGQLNKNIFEKDKCKAGVEFDRGDILFGKLRPYLENWLLADFKGVAVGDFWVLRPNEAKSRFIYYLIQSDTFQAVANLSAGTKMPRSDWNVVSETNFGAPSVFEQTAIGDFFHTLDSIIASVQRKLIMAKKMKQAFLQRMFPQAGETVPKVRFAGFTEPWEARKLGEVIERVQGNDGRMYLPTLTISAASGWLDQRERFSSNIAGKEQENYTLLSKGELSYNKGNSKLARYGAVFELKTYEEALVPRVYHSFRTTKELNATFLEYMFATKIPDNELAKLVTSSARMDGLLNIGFEVFAGISICIPNKDEQDTICRFLHILDIQITTQQTKLDNLKRLKSAFLQKMFV